MAEFTGKWFGIDKCTAFDGKSVNVLEYKDNEKHVRGWHYERCTRCGKPLKKIWYVVQDEDDVEIAYLGAECVKHLA